MSEGIYVWPAPVRLADVAGYRRAAPMTRRLCADEAARARIATALELAGLDQLEADLTLSSWFDGVQIEGRWDASVTQICGVSLEPFSTPLAGEFQLRLVPATSVHAPVATDAEVVIDLDAEDPPDVLEGEVIDLGAYVIEHLALEIDPFPRKPDAVFEPPKPIAEISPFAALRDWGGGATADDESGAD